MAVAYEATSGEVVCCSYCGNEITSSTFFMARNGDDQGFLCPGYCRDMAQIAHPWLTTEKLILYRRPIRHEEAQKPAKAV